eukprot:jgi/Galph1/3117/GphlegSOOS_G1787.1
MTAAPGGFDMSGLGPEDQGRLMAVMQDLQIQDSLRLYNELVQRCFGECVESFRSKKLDGKEEACVTKCAQKFLKMAARVGQRFAEHQQQLVTEAQQGTSPSTTK